MKDFRDDEYLGFFDCERAEHRIEHKFYENPLPFEIDPEKFTQFLKDINEHEGWGEYFRDASGNCEWSCVYIIKLAIENNFNDLCVCYGNYGFGEHYWISYKDWFIDLTLAQFKPEAPHLSITKRDETCSKGAYRNYIEYTMEEYLKQDLQLEEATLDAINEMIEKKLSVDNWLNDRISMQNKLEGSLNGFLS